MFDRIKAMLGMSGTLNLLAAYGTTPEKQSDKCKDGYTYVPAGKFHGMSYLNERGMPETPGDGFTQAFCISQSKLKTLNWYQASNYCVAAGGRLPDEIEWIKADSLQRQSLIAMTPLNVYDQWEWTRNVAGGYRLMRGGMITGDFMGDIYSADSILRRPTDMNAQFRCVLPVQK